MMQTKNDALLAGLQQSFAEAVTATGLQPGELCRRLLAGSIRKVEPIDVDTCEVTPVPGHFVRVTFSKPVADVAFLQAYKYRNPSNCAIVDGQGNWTGVVAYSYEWEGFLKAAVDYLNETFAHHANF